jgi:Ni,Fe-hydrogenase maturation factor
VPGTVVVIACEPTEVEQMGWGLSDEVGAAVDLVVETVEELRATPVAPAE